MAAKKNQTKASNATDFEALARLPDESPAPVMRIAANGDTLYANKHSLKIEGLINKSDGCIAKELVKAAMICFKKNKTMRQDFKSGDITYELFISPIKKHNYINFYGRDVSEARASMAQVHDLAKFPDENPNPVMRALGDGSILFSNEAAENLSGAITGGKSPRLNKSLSQAARSASRLKTSVKANLISGDETYLFTFNPVKGERYINIYGREITAEIEAQRELEASNDLLEQRVAERTASVKLLQNIVLAANSAESLEAALQTALHEICIYTNWPVGHAYIVDSVDGKKELVPTGIWHIETDSKYSDLRKATERGRFGGYEDLPGRVIERGREVWIEYLSKEKKFPRLGFTKKAGLVSGMAFPVTSGGNVIGVLEFFAQKRAQTDSDIIKTLEHVGAQLGSVADRKNAEAAVAASQADAATAHSRLENAIEVMGQALALFDKDDNLVLFNKRYSEFIAEFGGSDPQVGDNFEEIVRGTTPIGHEDDTPEEKEEWVQRLLKVRRTSKVRESVDRTKSGRWLRTEGFDTEEGGTVSIFTDITESKEHEQELSKLVEEAELAHNRLSDAIEVLDQGFVLYDKDDRIAMFNSKYAEQNKATTGYDVKIGDTFEYAIRQAVKAGKIENARKFGEKWIQEVLKERREDKVRDSTSQLGSGAWYRAQGFTTSEGGTVSIFTDVTKTKIHEQELARLAEEADLAHARLRDAIESIGQGFALFDAEDRVILFNKQYNELITKLVGEAKVGDKFSDMLKRTKRTDFKGLTKKQWMKKVLDERAAPGPRNSTNRLPDGTWYQAEGFHTSDGGNVSIFTDITDLKNNEEKLDKLVKEAELAHGRLMDAIEVIDQGFVLFDAADNFVLFNKRYEDMMKLLSHNPKIGMNFEEIVRSTKKTDFGDETKDQWVKRILKGRRENETRSTTERMAGGWYKSEGFRTEEGGIVSIFTDVTELKQHEAELDELVTEIGVARDEAVNANSAKSQFLANMSHELRTPLNAIIGYSELLIDDATDDENDDYIPDLQKIQSAGKHLLGLINDILDLSKIEVGKIEVFVEDFAVTELLEDVANTIRPLVEKNNNTLVLDYGKNVENISSDMTKLRQNLFNLLSNAAKFSKDSTLTVRTSIEASDKGDLIVFDVIDEGIGMTPEQLAKIFDPFTQADSSTSKKFGGTGLGLTITREFSRMLGGDITVTSELGVGTTFTMKVSVDANTIANDDPSEAVSANVPRGGDTPTVLVIDDDPNVRDLLSRNLSSNGYHTDVAKDGKEGLRKAKELKPDAITLDVIMPHSDGWSVLSELKSNPETADIPVIMVTIVEDKKLGFSLGASEYLSKPVDRKKLIDVLNRFLGESKNRSVLVIEDDAKTRNVIHKYLEREDVDVVEAENGRIGVEKLKISKPGMILLDLMMPEMDGFGFIDEYRKNPEWHSIPIIVVTAKTLTKADKKKLDGWVEGLYSKLETSIEQVMEDIKSKLPH